MYPSYSLLLLCQSGSCTFCKPIFPKGLCGTVSCPTWPGQYLSVALSSLWFFHFSALLGIRRFPPPDGLTFSSWFLINKMSSAHDYHPLRFLTLLRHMARTEEVFVCFAVRFSPTEGCLTISTEEVAFEALGEDLRTRGPIYGLSESRLTKAWDVENLKSSSPGLLEKLKPKPEFVPRKHFWFFNTGINSLCTCFSNSMWDLLAVL